MEFDVSNHSTVRGRGENPLIRRLDGFVRLGEAEKAALAAAITGPRKLGPRQEMFGPKDPPGGLVILISGFACRFRLLPNGRRQILAYMAPGEFCDMRAEQLRRLDHSVSAVSQASVCTLPREAVVDLIASHPKIGEAMRVARWIEDSVMREWLVNLGLRTAYERMAALLCEFYLRLNAVGLVTSGSCEFPFTQSELGEMLGLSAVHINRTLQDLRRDGLISLTARRLVIRDLAALAGAGMFDADYLHVRKPSSGALGGR